MKQTVKVLALILVIAMFATLLVACGESAEAKAAVGTYKGQYTKYVGDSDEYRVTDEEFSLELKSGGKGTHYRDDLELSITWTLDGENFTMTESFLGAKTTYTGTLKDGKLDIFNGDPTDIWTCEYVYDKQ